MFNPPKVMTNPQKVMATCYPPNVRTTVILLREMCNLQDNTLIKNQNKEKCNQGFEIHLYHGSENQNTYGYIE